MPLKIIHKGPVEQIARNNYSIFNFILVFDAELAQVYEQTGEHEACEEDIEGLFQFPALVADEVWVNLPDIPDILVDARNGHKIGHRSHKNRPLGKHIIDPLPINS